jgi:hypothetical protein
VGRIIGFDTVLKERDESVSYSCLSRYCLLWVSKSILNVWSCWADGRPCLADLFGSTALENPCRKSKDRWAILLILLGNDVQAPLLRSSVSLCIAAHGPDLSCSFFSLVVAAIHGSRATLLFLNGRTLYMYIRLHGWLSLTSRGIRSEATSSYINFCLDAEEVCIHAR